MAHFSEVVGFVKIENGVTSDPVPEVVATATMGNVSDVTGKPIFPPTVT